MVHRPTLLPDLPALASEDPDTREPGHGSPEFLVEQHGIGIIGVDEGCRPWVTHQRLVGFEQARVFHQVGVVGVVEPVGRGGVKGGEV